MPKRQIHPEVFSRVHCGAKKAFFQPVAQHTDNQRKTQKRATPGLKQSRERARSVVPDGLFRMTEEASSHLQKAFPATLERLKRQFSEH